ncbi:hypothetical protein FRB95_008787 [Tulasnella sp. JGI-2019a]|nr:hypothetical protein FRB95_008787 [Tulasnella sp. JGI-2019a]
MNSIFPPAIAALLSPKLSDFPTEEYSGLEWRYGKIVLRPAMFKTEGLILGALLLYYLFSFVSSTLKARKASAWVEAHQNLYNSQFSRPGTPDTVLADGPTDYFLFSTGRRTVAYLHTIIAFWPSHDLVQVVYETVNSIIDLSYSPKDTVTLDFQLSGPPSPGFVFGIISKLHMKNLRKERFDLMYFTKSSTNTALPAAVTLMSESADISDLILKSTAGTALLAKIADPVVGKYLRSLIISDQPTERPTKGPIPADKRHTQVTLSLDLPPSSNLAVTESLVRAVFDLIDFLDGKLSIREDIVRKLSNTRQALDVQLTKEVTETSTEEKEEAEEAKRAAKRKLEEEKFAGLTPEQQKKHEEKERQRSLRKAQKKMASR